MSRSARLLDLLQALRRRRGPVSAGTLAEELGVSLRTLYRDVATLRAQGADIAGEAGVGYVLRPGFLLPPLMFGRDEIEALLLGMRYVVGQPDEPLAAAAADVLARIAAVLPPEAKRGLDQTWLMVGPGGAETGAVDLAALRAAIREERMVEIAYRDLEDRTTERRIWPIALTDFRRAFVVVAWCELRLAYRHFRVDRIDALGVIATRYPRRREAMLAEWRAAEGIAPPP